MSTIPQSLDWVSVRAACTIVRVFNEICNEIDADILEINSARKLTDHNQFRADSLGGSTIVVGQPSRFPRVVVKIGVVGNEIEVQDDATKSRWRVNISLNNEGRCVLKNNEEGEMEHWQFRKRALENLFFGNEQ